MVLGDSSVGKTSLLLRFVKNKFPDSHKATIGADFLDKKIPHNGKTYNLNVTLIIRSGILQDNKSLIPSESNFIKAPIAAYSFLM